MSLWIAHHCAACRERDQEDCAACSTTIYRADVYAEGRRVAFLMLCDDGELFAVYLASDREED